MNYSISDLIHGNRYKLNSNIWNEVCYFEITAIYSLNLLTYEMTNFSLLDSIYMMCEVPHYMLGNNSKISFF